jgi:penicillin-binding protein A
VEAGGRRGAHAAPRFSHADVERRRRLLRRLLPALAGAAVFALVAGLLLSGGAGRAERETAQRFATFWAGGDYARMYELLDAEAKARVTFADFAAAYREATQTATMRSIAVVEVGDRADGRIPVKLAIDTRVFGTVRGTLALPVSGEGEQLRIAWREQAVFPGLRFGEQLTRQTSLAPRADLLARDGTVLARGDDRSSDDPELAAHIAGRLEPAPADEQGRLRALGYPPDALVGVSGLERVFQDELAGAPGGTLLAGGRALARSEPRRGAAVRTTISPEIERAAVAALAGRYGGVAAVDPRTGEVLALAGVAFSALQPPGSTFKIITLTGALEAGITKPGETFPVESGTTIEGVSIENANGEYCGGTLVASFAHSCNSVFAPLGAELGAKRFVDAAERFGFNEPIPIAGAEMSTIPSAEEIGDDLAVGSSAIGQGLVQATTLEMTLVAATIAMDGRRPLPTLRLGARPQFVRVTEPRVARQVARMMRAVVSYGTGTAAAIAGGDVAGKTGTAELRSTVRAEGEEDPAHLDDGIPDTDAWFVAYAPAKRPRVAVGALFVEAGAGGDVAAPAARDVLAAALQRPRGG